jgi:hypothetical protein
VRVSTELFRIADEKEEEVFEFGPPMRDDVKDEVES